MSGEGASARPLLEVADLHVGFRTRTGVVEAVRGISFTVGRERIGIVGESGSGKTMTGRAILRLVRPPGFVEARRIALEGVDLLKLSERQMRRRPGHQGRRGEASVFSPQDKTEASDRCKQRN